jgi:hypothetical protein
VAAVTDLEFLLEVLADGELHSTSEILARSIEERGHGLTVHSRISDLRGRGHKVEHLTRQGAQRGHANVYRLISSPLEEAPSSRASGVSSNGKPSFAAVAVSAQRVIGDGAAYRFMVRRTRGRDAVWAGADAGLLQRRRASAAAAPASLASAPVSLVVGEPEQLALEAA